MKSLAVLILFLAAFRSHANPPRCEDLFSRDSSIEQTAQLLAHFREDVIREVDHTKKAMLANEFDAMFEKFKIHVGDPVKALQIYSEARVASQGDRKLSRAERLSLEKDKKDRKQREEKKLAEWRHFKEIEGYHSSYVEQFYFMPDGSFLLSRDQHGEIKMLNLKTLKTVDLALEGERHLMNFTPDGQKMITVTQQGRIKLLDFSTMEEIELPNLQPSKGVREAFITPDGSKYVTVSFDNDIKILDLQALTEIPNPAPKDAFLGWRQMTLIPEGSLLLALGEERNELKYLDLSHPENTGSFKLNGDERIRNFVVIPGASKVALSDMSGEIRFFDVSTKQETSAPSRYSSFVTFMAMSDDGSKLVTYVRRKVSVLDLKTMQYFPHTFTDSDQANALVISKDGNKLLLTRDNNKIPQLVDLDSMTEIWSAAEKLNAKTVFTPDGSKLISADPYGNLFIWFENPDEAEKMGAIP